jgi:hypothetical protein
MSVTGPFLRSKKRTLRGFRATSAFDPLTDSCGSAACDTGIPVPSGRKSWCAVAPNLQESGSDSWLHSFTQQQPPANSTSLFQGRSSPVLDGAGAQFESETGYKVVTGDVGAGLIRRIDAGDRQQRDLLLHQASRSADSRMATSRSTVPPLTPTATTLWPSLVSGAPPPIEQNLPSDSPIRGKSSCPGCTSGKRSAVRSHTSAEHRRMRINDWDPIRGGHYGQRSCKPHAKYWIAITSGKRRPSL